MVGHGSSPPPYRLGLLVCGHVHPDVVHLAGDYPELFGALLAPVGIEVVAYHADRGVLPASIQECDGWATSPARASVNDNEPWIRDVEELIARIVVEERPFVGICFGHQLLARTLGGAVARAPGGWEVGAQRYDVVARRWWMDPPADHLTLVASHEDQVITLPDGADLLARSDRCPHAMFAVGERVIGIQAHPELTADASLALTDLRADLIGPAATARARSSFTGPLDRQLVAGWIARFLAGR